jgi:invasion protein IalB
VKTNVRGWVCAVVVLILSSSAAFLGGCSGLVSSANTTPPLPTLNITNVQTGSVTTSSSQVVWTTNVPANSSVDYGTTSAYGNSTPIDSTMVTSHLVTISGLAAGTTYYYQVNSADSKNNHGKSGGHTIQTAGFSIAGTISPAPGGSAATVTLSGAASTTATADSTGNYAFTGLPNGTYTVAPSHAGYMFTPSSKSMTVNGTDVAGVNFTDAPQAFSISGTITPTAGGSGAMVTLTGAASATTTANSSGAYTFSGLAGGSYTITPNHTGYTFTPASQNVSVSTANATGVNFTDSAAAVAPTITTPPANQTVTAGQTATFTVVAAGTVPLSYQWQKNGANIAGATAASYTTPVTATSDSGSTFAVVVSNTAGTVTSAATLTVNAPAVAPTITTPPANQTVTAGQTATFTVVAAGTAPLSYQWQKNGANIAGATAASYTTLATTTSDSGSTFDVAVTNTVGTVTSTAATLTVSPAPVAPTITTPPANQTVTAGQTATFTVVAAGTAPLSYQWQKNGANIAGAAAASYTTPAMTTADSGSTFAVVVTNTAGTVTSSAATLTVNPAPVAPTITTPPANQMVTAGQTATFTVVAAGTAPLSYQWQKNGANIAGANSTSYTTPATATADSGSTFDVVVSNAAGTVTSTAATLTVSPAPVAPTITTPPANQTVTAGQTATFTVVAAGTAPLSYQWQKNGANIAGATLSSYTTPVTTSADSGSTFDVVVTNTAGTVTSAAAAMTVNPAPAPAIQVSPINFGNDVVGTNLSQALIIKNTGTATLTITQVTETGSAFFTVSGFSLPLNVNAGQQTTITVVFLPTSVGPASGNISITSNAPTSPTSVALAGTGIAATLTLNISPTSLSFGNVTTGTSSATQNVTITSTGNSSVAISQINLVGAGYTMTGGGAPVTLSPTQSITLVVQFSPTTAGIVPGSITVVSNATGSPATITLSATGVAPIQHSAALTWNASTSTVSGYNVYRSTTSGTGYAKINTSLVTALTFTDSTVQSATTYFYVTTAVDSSGRESVYSNEVAAPIP